MKKGSTEISPKPLQPFWLKYRAHTPHGIVLSASSGFYPVPRNYLSSSPFTFELCAFSLHPISSEALLERIPL
jgi:hypothetical protein